MSKELRQAYEDYKKAWVDDHIGENVKRRTKQAYQDYIKYFNVTFEEYIDEYGYINGECYVCFDEFCNNELIEVD